MHIVVLSDTHLREGKSLPKIVWDHLEKADLILHAGDLTHMSLINELACIAPVRGVSGNCDGWDVRLPDQDIVECESLKIGLIHGSSGKGKTTPERAYYAFLESEVDIIVFGHSHSPFMEWRNGILLFNPGSPTDKRREQNFSFGLMDIEHGQVKAKHVCF
ncbi:phosphoesterase, MJ0936 family [Desulfosporosinus orientis DSM 765]|uniref:Phosphoesterase n=1 Tax=Desulfosporosinus orientis (strain ATCC 19365 / DSM 765 / NCIMB 8382 / VKM B-1628 / Singapore I) TaxID=768706 RepID=G7WFL8_DESOD|nr:metallophosphoesterase [Desulfosporosinus orientis]AET68891.1 phosphoesterase, MJ0936 family [Desulfosporosinus orientis DSM 765]